MTFNRAVAGFYLTALLVFAGGLRADSAASPEALQFFERKVRPLLAGSCYKCHGQKKQKGKLRLDRHEAILSGGDSALPLCPASRRRVCW